MIALEAADDQHHAAAVTLWNDIRNQRVSFVTTSYVFDEVVTFFNSRGHHAKAVSIGETPLTSKLVTLVHVNEAMFAEAWRDFTHYADKRFSLTDCVSFVVMKRRRTEGLRRTCGPCLDKHCEFKELCPQAYSPCGHG